MLLIDSLYINNSGGKVLLDYLVSELEKSSLDVHYLFDKRLYDSYEIKANNRKTYLKASLLNRLIFYLKNKRRFHKILCFGNMPPLVNSKHVTVYTYFHNLLIIECPKGYLFWLKAYARIQKQFIKLTKNHTDYWVVQSHYVARELSSSLQVEFDKMKVIPFYNINISNPSDIKEKSFIYPCSGSPHKNLDRLLSAWEKLYTEGFTPCLNLTLSEEWEDLHKRIILLNRQGLNIVNHGIIPNNKLLELFQKSQYLIYPSLVESFGLPLIEAVKSGCKVIASDLPFTYAVVKPSYTFNPYEENSIKEAVKYSLSHTLQDSQCMVNDEIDCLIRLVS